MRKIEEIKYAIKRSFQRMFRGFDDYAVWEFNSWFLQTTSKIIEKMANEHFGYPPSMTDEEWTATLHRLAFCLKEASDDTSMKNKYEDSYDQMLLAKQHNYLENNKEAISKLYIEEEEKIFKYKQQMLIEAFDIMKENFWHLWD